MLTYSLLNCIECQQIIRDPYYLQIDGETWHEKCAQCSICHCFLKGSCYTRQGHLFCRKDYMNRFGIHCRGCGKLIKPNDSVLRSYSCRRISTDSQLDVDPKSKIDYNFGSQLNYSEGQNKSQKILDNCTVSQPPKSNWIGLQYFHELCFKCCMCNRLLRPGEEYTLKGFLPICIADYRMQFDSDLDSPLGSKSTSNRCKPNNEEDHFFMHSIPDSNDDCSKNCKQEDFPGNDSHLQSDTEQMQLSVLIPDTTISAASSSGSSSKAYEDHADEDDLFELDSDSESGRNCKRPRTILTATQRRRFKAVFDMNPKPSRKVRESLAMETGLNIRVVQVWFQNQRAKIKKLARRHAQETRNSTNRKLFGSSTVFSDSIEFIKSGIAHTVGPVGNQNLSCPNPSLSNCGLGIPFVTATIDKSNETNNSFKQHGDLELTIGDETGKIPCFDDIHPVLHSNPQTMIAQGDNLAQTQSSSTSPGQVLFRTTTDNDEVSSSYSLPIFNSITPDNFKTIDPNMSSLFSGDNLTMQHLFLTSTLMGSLSQEDINVLKLTVQGSQMNTLNEQTSDRPINKLYSMQHSYFM